MKKRYSFLLTIIIIFTNTIILVAQISENIPIENRFFQSIRASQNESYITFGQGLGNIEALVFEGLVAPYFLIRTNKDAKWGATLSPAILIRMRAEPSFPVKRPSYMPNITFYHSLSSTVNDKIKYIFLTIQHHSNGQDDSFFNDDGSINTYSGDFSTNFFELGTFLNRNIVPFSATTEYFSSSIEYHVNIDRSVELENIYSFIRWNNSIKISKFSFSNLKFLLSEENIQYKTIPLVQTRIETNWLFGTIGNAKFFDLGKRLNITAAISFRPKVLKDVSIFTKFYSGEDYYNMNFNRRINTLQIGLQAFGYL